MIENREVIVLQELNLTTLPRIEVPLAHDVLKTPMIGIDLTSNYIQVVPPNLKRENYRRQLQVMSGVVALMDLKLPRRISNNSALLHQYTTQTNAECVTINCRALALNWKSQYRRKWSITP